MKKKEIVDPDTIFLNCPNCKISIPQIKLFQTSLNFNHNISVKLNCFTCNYQTQLFLQEYLFFLKLPINIKNQSCTQRQSHYYPIKYCMHCRKYVCIICMENHIIYKFNHTFISHEIIQDYLCHLHPQCINIIYCITCKKKLCKKCYKKIHELHEIFDLNRAIDDEVKEVREYIAMKKQHNKDYMNAVVLEIDKYKGPQFAKTRKALEDAYEVNNDTYNGLDCLLRIAHNSYKQISDIESYWLIDRIRRKFIFWNNQQPDLYWDNFENTSLALTKYYNEENFIYTKDKRGNWLRKWNEFKSKPSIVQFIYFCLEIIIIIFNSNLSFTL